MKVTKPVPLNNNEEEAQKTRKPQKMPLPEGEARMYITGIKEECPMEGFSVLGLQFQKTVYSSERGYIQNQDKTYMPQLIARMLTENQFKALMERAKEIEFKITVANPEFDNEKKLDKNNMKWIQKDIIASDYIVLVPAEDYRAIAIPNKIDEKVVNNIFDNADKTIYDAQKKKK
jgi:hypothetical protein